MTSLLTGFLGRGKKPPTEAFGRHREVKKRIRYHAALTEADITAFDTELTGLDFRRDSIISIGAVKLRGGSIRPGRTFYRLVKPEAELRHQGVVIHGITHSELAEAEDVARALDDFLVFIGDSVLIGHFVFIDINFVSRALKRQYGTGLQSPAADTATLHDWLRENDSGFSRHHRGMTVSDDLFAMAARYGITTERSHNALYDAFITAQLFQRFVPFLSGAGVNTLRELLMISKN